MNLSPGAWATLIIASAILYGGCVYYILIALHLKPQDLVKHINAKEITGLWKASRNNQIMMASAAAVVVLMLIMLVFFMANPPQLEAGGGGAEEPIMDDEGEGNFTFTTERAMEDSGTIMVPSPVTQSSYADVPFEVRENGFKLWVNLTHTGGGMARADFDLYILGPDGDEIASSASPEADENAVLEEKALKRAGAGTYTARIVAYTGVAMSYSISADVMYKIPLNETSGTTEEELPDLGPIFW